MLRYRNDCRPVAGARVVLSEASSIDVPSIDDCKLSASIPYKLRKNGPNKSSNESLRLVATVSHQAHPREGRAQQRNIIAATGLISLGLRIHPRPCFQSDDSWRLFRESVNAGCALICNSGGIFTVIDPRHARRDDLIP
jgi:hypothetical protein